MKSRFFMCAILTATLCGAANAQVYNGSVPIPSALAGQNAGGADAAGMDRSNGFATAGGSGAARTDSATSGTEPSGDGTSRSVGPVTPVTAVPATSVIQNR